MPREIEISSLDLRYAHLRLRSPGQEARLLSSIAQRGIEEALEGVDHAGTAVLLNGFKRYRCACKLGIEIVPYTALSEDEGTAIVALLRISNSKGLSILEQAGFIDELRTSHRYGVAEIADLLSRSKAWVSMRTGLISEMTERIRQALFRGAFPVYSYMYTLRQFMRMNSVSKEQIEEFVVALSGQSLSVREIEQLAHGYFRGPESFREQVDSGNYAVVLEHARHGRRDPQGCNAFEKGLLKDLEIVGRYMQRSMGKSQDQRLKSGAFYAQANLLTGGILSRCEPFTCSMRQLHDRSGQTQGDLLSAPRGNGVAGDSATHEGESQYGETYHSSRGREAPSSTPATENRR